jgi:hypothetical protein
VLAPADSEAVAADGKRLGRRGQNAAGTARKLPEPAAPAAEAELAAAQRAAELLAPELAVSGRALFAAAHAHVEEAKATLAVASPPTTTASTSSSAGARGARRTRHARRRGSLSYHRTGSLVDVATLLGDSKRVAEDHYVYGLTDHREVDRTIALARAVA